MGAFHVKSRNCSLVETFGDVVGLVDKYSNEQHHWTTTKLVSNQYITIDEIEKDLNMKRTHVTKSNATNIRGESQIPIIAPLFLLIIHT